MGARKEPFYLSDKGCLHLSHPNSCVDPCEVIVVAQVYASLGPLEPRIREEKVGRIYREVGLGAITLKGQ